MKVCITGASGLIGRSLVQELGHDPEISVTAVTRTLPALPGAETGGAGRSVTWVRADLSSPPDCERIVSGADVLIHLAHTFSPLTSDADMASDTLLNLVPTLHLLGAVQRAGHRPHVIYPSSGGVIYGVHAGGRPFHEDDPCAPSNSYGIQKLATEHYLRLGAERGHLTASVLRIANAYGWVHSPDRQQGLVGTALHQALHGQPVRIIGNPANVRDYVHIRDIAAAVRLCLGRRAAFEVFNIGTGRGASVAEVIGLIERVLGRAVERRMDDDARGRFLPNWCVLDVGRARDELGWVARIGLEEGIRLTVQESGLAPLPAGSGR
jgi:UDP-glucose 4-epimerase